MEFELQELGESLGESLAWPGRKRESSRPSKGGIL
tara:strand:+ start:446 stop:550 length:105 start_codon:yes stop_codon:yes gene_type:complete